MRPNVRHIRLAAVVLITVAAITGGVTASSGSAAERSANPLTPDNYQSQLLGAAHRAPNYTGASVHGRDVTDLWGVAYPVPEVKQLLQNPPPGDTATWHRAPYAFRPLNREAVRLITKFHYINVTYAANNGSYIYIGTLNQTLLGSYDPQSILGTTYPVIVRKAAPGHGKQPPNVHTR